MVDLLDHHYHNSTKHLKFKAMLKINYPVQEQREYEHYSISPSGLENCSRQLCYKYNNVEKTNIPPPENQAKMEMGTILHDWFTGLIEGVVEAEVLHEVEKWGFTWRYKIDAVTSEMDDNFNEERVINEIKTVPAFSFKNFDTKLDTKSHLRQIQIYMLLEEVKHGRLIYLNRDNGKWLAWDLYLVDAEKLHFKILKNDNANGSAIAGFQEYMPLDTILKKHQDISLAVDKDILLPRQFEMHCKMVNGELKEKFTSNGKQYKSNWQCSYCDWKDKCWNLREFKESGEEFLANYLNQYPLEK